MRKFLLFFLLLGVQFSYAQGVNKQYFIQQMQKLENEFAPDKRTSIFEYSIDPVNKKAILKTDNVNLLKKAGKFNGSLGGYKLEIKLLPDEELGDEVYGLVNLSVINIRKEPKHASELVTQAVLGTPVKIYEKEGEWYRIQTPDKYIGWTDNDGIALKNFQTLDEWKLSEKLLYTKEFGFIFEKPDVNSLHVSDIVAGSIMKFIGPEGDYCKVEYPDGKTGYVPKNECTNYKNWVNNPVTDASKILNTSYKFLGLPYLWGGTSVKGVDCSGFTKTVFYLNGIMLPRDASQQVNTGLDIDTKTGFQNLMPGDLLFFGKKGDKNTPDKITHVGIYIGNMEFIHSSGKVKINSLDPKAKNFNEYRYRTFIKAKRILNSIGKNGIEFVKDNDFYME